MAQVPSVYSQELLTTIAVIIRSLGAQRLLSRTIDYYSSHHHVSRHPAFTLKTPQHPKKLWTTVAVIIRSLGAHLIIMCLGTQRLLLRAIDYYSSHHQESRRPAFTLKNYGRLLQSSSGV
ncbi:hypothetical protein J6590_002520 [Homalodisca vitripennis]|nr:hypothetical protein J6590_002520 [Homalodisca vitripennis]